MPIATLLLREDATASLAGLVEKSQNNHKGAQYELQLNNTSLDLIRRSSQPSKVSSTSTDEGFESDVDSLSIVSSDDSFTKPTTAETDSANGSASSDSDNDDKELSSRRDQIESFNLVDCICYTDVKFPNVLVFVIKTEALVFHFVDVNLLQNFYRNFTTLKAVSNQKKTYGGKNIEAKYNLLQRTDINGVTHIEITNGRGGEVKGKFFGSNKASSTDDILSLDQKVDLVNSNNSNALRKVWTSAECLLDVPKRPERRKKQKPKAPPPPVDVFSGQYVRVNVNVDAVKDRLIVKSQCSEPHPKKLQQRNGNALVSFLKTNQKQVVKYHDTNSLTRSVARKPEGSWTNSVPRLLRKPPRSRSETRNFQPMAYRYIDTTQSYPVTYSVQPTTPRLTSNVPLIAANSAHLGNRFFGLSPKLKDFNQVSDGGRCWGSASELSKDGGHLKSVIKKEENQKKKKVTFSAYTTVQVV